MPQALNPPRWGSLLRCHDTTWHYSRPGLKDFAWTGRISEANCVLNAYNYVYMCTIMRRNEKSHSMNGIAIDSKNSQIGII